MMRNFSLLIVVGFAINLAKDFPSVSLAPWATRESIKVGHSSRSQGRDVFGDHNLSSLPRRSVCVGGSKEFAVRDRHGETTSTDAVERTPLDNVRSALTDIASIVAIVPIPEPSRVRKSARSDITIVDLTNDTDGTIRTEAPIPSSQKIFVPGDMAIDGKTFRLGIKGSHTTKPKPGVDRVSIELPPKTTRILVSHYRFVLEDVAEPNGKTKEPAMRWVGTMIGFGVLYELPDNLDEVNSDSAPLTDSSE